MTDKWESERSLEERGNRLPEMQTRRPLIMPSLSDHNRQIVVAIATASRRTNGQERLVGTS